jgi:hypothetical protein
MFNSSDLVIAIRNENFHLATKIYDSGIRLTFIKTMVTQAKKNKDIKFLNWSYLNMKPKLNIEDLKYAFNYGDSEFIINTWNLCEPPDFIETVDILEIIINRNCNNEFFNLFIALRKKHLKVFKPHIEQLFARKNGFNHLIY